ncbi:MAG: hypothetical protein N5P05_004201 (plasmid) [Chroococcopsis gigantea SAG 12.99]|nr:hypothetical protein [Chroococcopsis gigantea SAG 12.99]
MEEENLGEKLFKLNSSINQWFTGTKLDKTHAASLTSDVIVEKGKAGSDSSIINKNANPPSAVFTFTLAAPI